MVNKSENRLINKIEIEMTKLCFFALLLISTALKPPTDLESRDQRTMTHYSSNLVVLSESDLEVPSDQAVRGSLLETSFENTIRHYFDASDRLEDWMNGFDIFNVYDFKHHKTVRQ